MSIIRVRFARGEEVKFISHLDLMKAFERTLRRMGLPVAYSQGFNPHPQMVFGLPLPVGVTSEAEYADFELSRDYDPSEFMEKLNAGLPRGLFILDAKLWQARGNIMASIAGAEYTIMVFLTEALEPDKFAGAVARFLEKTSVIVKKEGKAGVKDVDIRPLILKLEAVPETRKPPGYEEFGSAFRLKAVLRAGSSANLRPELLATALSGESGLGFKACRMHRSGLFVEKGGRFADPMDEVV